jgi:hypothetical protein
MIYDSKKNVVQGSGKAIQTISNINQWQRQLGARGTLQLTVFCSQPEQVSRLFSDLDQMGLEFQIDRGLHERWEEALQGKQAKYQSIFPAWNDKGKPR